MSTPVTNFAKGTVGAAYTSSATSIALLAGHGSRFPSTFPYPATWWNSTDYPDPADDPDREIVTVTARAGDTLTVTRGAEGTVASHKNITAKTYKLIAGITAQMWQDLSSQNLSQSFRGLVVQNHPDSDARYSKLMFSADAIVMDDGQEIQNWSNVVADLAASGAGGLDTGIEGSGVAYELYAISDGGTNKKGLLHRAKDYLLDQSQTTIDGNHRLRDAAAREKLAQGVKFTTAGPLEFVDLWLLRLGSPTGNFWVTLESDSGGVPSGTALATSTKYDVSNLPSGAFIYVRIPFRTPYSVSAATQYHLVLQGDFTVSASHHLAWGADTTAAAYPNGAKAAYDGATWTTDTDDDFAFKAYVSRNDTAVTMPTGYTQKALICPFIYNDTGGNLLLFQQKDRTIHCHAQVPNALSSADDWAIFTAGSGPVTATLYHLGALTPPRPCTVHVAFGNTSSLVNAGFGHISAFWMVSSLSSGPGFLGHTSTPYAVADGACSSPERAVLVEYQGLVALTGGANTFARINRIEW